MAGSRCVTRVGIGAGRQERVGGVREERNVSNAEPGGKTALSALTRNLNRSERIPTCSRVFPVANISKVTLVGNLVFGPNSTPAPDPIATLIGFVLLLAAFAVFVYRTRLLRTVTHRLSSLVADLQERFGFRRDRSEMRNRLRREVEALQREIAALNAKLEPAFRDEVRNTRDGDRQNTGDFERAAREADG